MGVAWAGGPDGYNEDNGYVEPAVNSDPSDDVYEAVGSGYVGDSLVGFRATGDNKGAATANVIAACEAGGGMDCSWDEVTSDNLCIVSIGNDNTGQVGGGAGANPAAARDDAFAHAAEGGYPFDPSARTLIEACP
ncbi:hypothetical protein [Mycolicibacterium brumae]|nr:hypothetical protein [Mycolicibacterium brumae]RWA20610.1 hypothetical protein MBRU_02825 [Mycolicibacterium brumae DSM 44177]UWW07708.1 hypothetical protein L2Z93_000735 [Mycolicibacterium brumae]